MQLFVDGEMYGTVDPGEGFYNTARQNAVPHAMHWVKGSVMAPLDEMVLKIIIRSILSNYSLVILT